MNKSILTFCEKAARQLKIISNKSGNKSILIGVKGGGCNGLKYYIEPTDDKPSKIDEQLDIVGIHVIVCGKSLFHILGTNVTWRTDYMGNRFDFDNPNASGSCGCGETFSVD